MKKAKKDKKECFCVRLIKNLGSNVKKIDLFDVSLPKLSVASGVLFLLTVWPKLLSLVLKADWIWYFVAMILLAIRPVYHFFGKKK